MNTVTFANGETHNCTFLTTVPDGSTTKIFIALDDVSVVEASKIFSDPDVISEIRYGNSTFTGYTTLEGLYIQPYGIQAVLRRD